MRQRGGSARRNGGRSITLVALTGWGQADDRRRSGEAGFDHHLTRPVEFSALQKLLAETPAGERQT
jgi:CheY-like chemotaxis protein